MPTTFDLLAPLWHVSCENTSAAALIDSLHQSVHYSWVMLITAHPLPTTKPQTRPNRPTLRCAFLIWKSVWWCRPLWKSDCMQPHSVQVSGLDVCSSRGLEECLKSPWLSSYSLTPGGSEISFAIQVLMYTCGEHSLRALLPVQRLFYYTVCMCWCLQCSLFSGPFFFVLSLFPFHFLWSPLSVCPSLSFCLSFLMSF